VGSYEIKVISEVCGVRGEWCFGINVNRGEGVGGNYEL